MNLCQQYLKHTSLIGLPLISRNSQSEKSDTKTDSPREKYPSSKIIRKPDKIRAAKNKRRIMWEMVFCYKIFSDLLWEKIVLVIEKNFWNSRLKAENFQNVWDH